MRQPGAYPDQPYDQTLMGLWGDSNGLYLQIAQNLMQPTSFLYRHIKHMKDYSGGRNQWLNCSLFVNGDYERLTTALLELRKPAEEKAVLKVA